MNYSVITTKVDPATKKSAQQTAQELGIPLSVLIKGFIKQLIRTKSVAFSVANEIPNTYLQGVLKRAEENYKKGNTSPAFKTGAAAVKYLEDQGV